MAQPSSAALTLSAAAAAYKELFPQRVVKQLSNRDRDFLRWVPKADEFTGYAVDDSGGHLHIPYRYSKPQGLGYNFADAQTADDGANSSGKVKTVKLARKRYYGYVTIDEEAAMASRDRKGSFYPVKQREMEDLIEQVSEDLEKACWRGKNGYLGVVSSIADEVITLTNADDVGNFSIGMRIGANQAADGSGTDVGLDAGGMYVVGIDIDAGTITLDGDYDTADGGTTITTAIAATDYLFRSSGFDVTANGDAGNLIVGVADWIPLVAETTTNTTLGIDRTDDVQRLQGWRQADEGSIELTIKKLFAKMMKYGAKPDSIWLSHDNWNQLEQELGSRATRVDGKAGKFGLPSLSYKSPKGDIPVYAASFMPNDRGYMLRRDTWKFYHLGGLPHVGMADGTRWRYLTGADAVEFRCKWYGNLACHNMFDNGVFNITSAS